MGKAKYVIDTCSLTKMRHTYPKGLFPAAWEKIDALATSGELISAADVWEELSVFEDEISAWAKNKNGFFHLLDANVQKRAASVLVTHPGLLDLRKNKSSADPFVIATALELNCIVVTEEKANNSTTKPKIPDVCRDLGVECINILEMFRREGLH